MYIVTDVHNIWKHMELLALPKNTASFPRRLKPC